MEEETVCPHCGYDPEEEADPSALEEGSLLQNGRYRLGAVLGKGGFGITYAAWDLTLGQPVAVKEYFPEGLCGRDISEGDDVNVPGQNHQAYQIGLLRFNREAGILATLQNVKSVVAVYDWFQENETAYLVMEYVRGRTIGEYVKKMKPDPDTLFGMLRDLVDSLVVIHELGILHRDISPDNILVQEDGTVKLIDFGAAVLEERRLQGKDQTVMFNRRFAPVEQYDENGQQGPWTDVYALSATLYYLLSGEYPQESVSRSGHDLLKEVHTQKGKLKKWQKRAITEGMAVSPSRRIQSMDIFRSILYHLPMPEEVRRRRRVALRAAAGAAAAGAAAALFLVNAAVGFPLGGNTLYGFRRDGLHIIKYKGTQEILDIPETRLGIPVTRIEEGAFSDDLVMKEVRIPGTVTRIGRRAFSGCRMLRRAELMDGVMEIGAGTFSGCTSLVTVSLPDTAARVGEGVFDGTGESLTVWCSRDSAGHQILETEDIRTAERNSFETIEEEGSIVITGFHGPLPSGTDNNAFYFPDYIDGLPVTELRPAGESLWEEAVSGPVEKSSQVGFTKVHLPRHLKKLPAGIVNGMTALETLEVGPELEEIEDQALFHCGLKELHLPDSLKKIGEQAISQSFLREIALPDSVAKAGRSAFSVNTRLTSVRIPAELEEISAGMFEACGNLEQVIFPRESRIKTIEAMGFSKCGSLERIAIPSSTEILGMHAFSDCIRLKAVYIPESVKVISETAFDGCPREMVILGRSGSAAETYAEKQKFAFAAMNQWDSRIGITDQDGLIYLEETEEEPIVRMPSVYTGRNTEKGAQVITKVEKAEGLKASVLYLPQFAEVVWGSAFEGNEYLKELYTYPKLRSIESSAFRKCPLLEQVHFFQGLSSIESYAFADDRRLSEISLPDTVEEIGEYAFWRCGSLEKLSIPAGVTLLSDGCFSETGLRAVTIPGNVSKCKTAFYGCTALEEAVLEDGVRTLLGTFGGCINLKTVIIPASMKRISRSTFRGCSSLQDVWIYADDVDMDLVWKGLKHITSMETKNGTVITDSEPLETERSSTAPLFADCPDVTLHGHPGSTAEKYAAEHGISFLPISGGAAAEQSDTEENVRTLTADQYDSLIPWTDDSADTLLGKLNYAWGYQEPELIQLCLEELRKAGSRPEYMENGTDLSAEADAAERFISQENNHHYSVGCMVSFFDGAEEHPSLRKGDIVTEIDGYVITTWEILPEVKSRSNKNEWIYTVLRPDQDGILRPENMVVKKSDPITGFHVLERKRFEDS